MNTEMREAHSQHLYRQPWYLGEQRDLYNGLLADNKSVWSLCQMSISPGSFKLNFDPLVKACMNASFEKASWENLQRKYASDNY